MSDPIGIVTSAISAIDAGIKILKGIKSVSDDYSALEQKNEILEVQASLTEAKTAIMDLKNVNMEYAEEIKRLKNFQKLKEEVTFKHNAYFRNSDTNFKEPFCSRCFDHEHILIHLIHSSRQRNNICPNCNASPIISL